MNLIETLQNLGLNEKEAKVYLALLKKNRGSAYWIAEESGLKKPTTYVILDDLIKKGLVYKVPREKKQQFVAKSPKEVLALAEERLISAKEALPELMALSEGEKPKPKTLFFEGLGAVRNALAWSNKRMKEKELVGFYAHAENIPNETLNLVWEYYADDFLKNNLRLRGIVPDHPNLKKYRENDAKYNRKLKVIPLIEYSANISIDIGDDFVSFFSFKDLQITRIENKDIATTMRQIFEMVWKSRPEKPQGAEF